MEQNFVVDIYANGVRHKHFIQDAEDLVILKAVLDKIARNAETSVSELMKEQFNDSQNAESVTPNA